jgi:hypothetical protein
MLRSILVALDGHPGVLPPRRSASGGRGRYGARVMGFLEDFRARSEAAGLAAAVLEGLGDPAERILREVQ